MLLRIFLLALLSGLFMGCASSPDSMHSKGDAIVIARHASWLHGGYGVGQPMMQVPAPDGNAVQTNAFGQAVGGEVRRATFGAGGGYIGGMVGGEVARSFVDTMSQGDPRNRSMSFKVLYEKDCSYDLVKFNPADSPEMLDVWPGHMVRSSSGISVELARDGSGGQRYLSKSHACYKTWVDEWKKHVAVVRRGGSSAWIKREYLLQTWADVADIPAPEYEWIR